MANLVALKGAIKILADAAVDAVSASQPGQTLTQKVSAFENLIPDAMQEIAVISDIKAEVASLQPSDYTDLASTLITDLNFSSAHAQAVVQASLKLLSDAGTSLIPDALALLHAVQNPPAAA